MDSTLRGEDPTEVLRRFEVRPDLVVGRWTLLSWHYKMMPVVWFGMLPLVVYALPALLDEYVSGFPGPEDLGTLLPIASLSCVILGVGLLLVRPIRLSCREETLLLNGRQHDLATLTVPRMVTTVVEPDKTLEPHGEPMRFPGIEVRREGPDGEQLVMFNHGVPRALRRRFPEIANEINETLYEHQRVQAARRVLERQASTASPYREGAR